MILNYKPTVNKVLNDSYGIAGKIAITNHTIHVKIIGVITGFKCCLLNGFVTPTIDMKLAPTKR